LCLTILLMLLRPSAVMAQDFYFQFSGHLLSEALTVIAERTGDNIAFDADQLGHVSPDREISGNSTPELLDALLEGTTFTYLHQYGSYLIIKKEDRTGPLTNARDSIRGILLDAGTGHALPWADIYLSSNHTHFYASSDGSFIIPTPENEPQDIYVSYLGYHPIDTTLSADGRSGPYIFRMEPKSALLEQVEIEAPKMPMLCVGPDAGQYLLRPASFNNLPSYGETDLFSALELLPGITYSQNASKLSIRGGAGDQNLVLFDGFTLYNLDHYFGAFSVLNPNAVEAIRVFKGGFDSRYGERVSGIIDARGKSGDSLASSVYGGINLLGANLTLEAPVSQKFSLLLSGRTGYSSILSNFMMENIYQDQQVSGSPWPEGREQSNIDPDYRFNDFNLKLRYLVRNNEEISLSAYSGMDKLQLKDQIIRQDVSSEITDDSRWYNYGLGLTWSKKWNHRISSSIQTGASGFLNTYESQVSMIQDSIGTPAGPGPGSSDVYPSPEQSGKMEENYLGDFYFGIRNTLRLNPNHQLDIGMITRKQLYSLYKESAQPGGSEDLSGSSGLWSIYLQDEITWNKNLRVKPGLRMNYYTMTGGFYLEPRLSASYSWDNGIRLKCSAGKYYQFLNKVASGEAYGYNREIWVLADEEQHPVLSSNHFILGTTYEKGDFTLDLEAYYKTYDGLQQWVTLASGPEKYDFRRPTSVLSFSEPPQTMIASGSGCSYGLDFLMKYQHNHYQGWLSYSLGRSLQRYDLINQGDDIPAPVDRLHALDLTQMYSAGNWNFSLVYLFSTGQPYIIANLKQNETAVLQVFRRLPNYHRVDVSTNYSFHIKKARFRLGLSIINLLNWQNYYDIDRRNFLFNNISYEQTSIIKSQGITPNIFLQFRF
jgi:ferric enterobactin receptor